jgi:hypothetical protein
LKYFRDHNGKRALWGFILMGAALFENFGYITGLFHFYDGMLTAVMFGTGAGLLGLTTGDRPRMP